MKKKGKTDEGMYEEVTACAIKRVIARQRDALMEDQGLRPDCAPRAN